MFMQRQFWRMGIEPSRYHLNIKRLALNLKPKTLNPINTHE